METTRDPLALSGTLMAQIEKGAFLTVKAGGALNTMTIGWGLIGFIWQRRVLMVAVRVSRHTFSLLEKAVDFTVTVPMADVEEALAFCGTKSGRDVDKLGACGLKAARAERTVSPRIDVPGVHLGLREARAGEPTGSRPSPPTPSAGRIRIAWRRSVPS